MPAPSGLQRSALEASYLRLEKPLFNVLLRWVWSREDAMDLMHEAFERVWRRRARVDEATLEPLLWKTALNLAANRRRAQKLRALFGLESAAELAAPEASSDARLASAQTGRAVRAAIDALPEKLRQVVVLCELSGLSYAAIAKTLELPVGTVASRRAAALEKLALALGPLQEDA
jgi:RNA polymerase sigma-70 factor (ECF subfamily)